MKHGVLPAVAASCDLEAIDTLVPYPGNARLHDDDLIAESLARNGQYKPVIVQVSSRHILAGNGTTEAAAALGWTHVAVQWVDVDDDRARRINLVDNRASDKARNDLGDLAEQLTVIADDLAGTGFTLDDLESIQAFNSTPLSFDTEDDDDPETARPTIGRHHIECPECGHIFPTK